MLTVFASHMTEIRWLAGRGYNVLGVTMPVTFHQEVDPTAVGSSAVLWETYRPSQPGEELGFAKIVRPPEPRIHRGVTLHRADGLQVHGR